MKFTLIFITFAYTSMSYGCKDMNMTILSVKNCIKNPIISIQDNFYVRATDKCIVLVDSCYDLKPFTKSSVELLLFQGKTRKHSEKIDVCNRNKKGKEVTEVIMLALGLNAYCPVTDEKVYCSKDRKIFEFTPVQLRLAKAMFGKPGILKLKSTFSHDTGKSCFEIEFNVEFSK